MAPYSRAALRLLTFVLLLNSLASTAALPASYGEVLASRADRQLDVPVTLNSNRDSKNFLDDLIDFLDEYDFKDLWKNLKGGLFGGRKQRPESTTEIGTKENGQSGAGIGPLETSIITTSSPVSTTASSTTRESSKASSGSSKPTSTSTSASPSSISSATTPSSVESVSSPFSTSDEPANLRTWPSLSTTSEERFFILPWPHPTHELRPPPAPSAGLIPNGTLAAVSSASSEPSSPYSSNGWIQTAAPPGYSIPNGTSVAVSSTASDLPSPYSSNGWIQTAAPPGYSISNGTSVAVSSKASDLPSRQSSNGGISTAAPPGYFIPNGTSVAVSSRTSNLPEFLYPLNVNITLTLESNSTSTVPGPATFTEEFTANPLIPNIVYGAEPTLSTPTSSISGLDPYIPTIRFTLPSGVPTGSVIPEIQIVPYPTPSAYTDFINGTTTIKQVSTKIITRTLIPPTTRPRWTNGTTLPFSTTVSTIEYYITDPVVFTYSAPSSVPSTTYAYDSVIPLREICSESNKDTIALPLLSLFYGPNAYPALHRFPGCTAPASNSSQAIRAPGLLNCTDLGVEVQSCQSKGHKVLLSVKGSGAGEVGGNTEYGDPTKNPQPFGPYFGNLGKNGSIENAVVSPRQPNLFDAYHPPSAFALTLFSLFSEGHTERADLRPLGPLALDGMTDDAPDGVKWWSKPLGEEVVVDGFDVQIPREWEGTYQEEQFNDFISRLKELTDAAWAESGSKKGGVGDLGADGKGVVYQGWI